MIKIYHKTVAEQFDGSKEMAKRYGVELYSESGYGYAVVEGEPDGDGYVIDTLEGELLVNIGDWIATGANGEHWLIYDDVFKETFAELPVIPKSVADWIEECKQKQVSISKMLCSENRPEKMRDWMAYTPGSYKFDNDRYHKYQELVARAWLDGYRVEAQHE